MTDAPIARVAVNVRSRPDAGPTFDYRVPAGLPVRPGHLVWVPFGSRRAQGIVVELAPTSDVPAASLRPIDDLIDPVPALRSYQVGLAAWLAGYYLAPLLDCLLLMLPPGLHQRGHARVSLTEQAMLPSLDPTDLRVVEYLRTRGAVDEARLRAGLRRTAGLTGALNQLESAGAIRRDWIVPSAQRPRRELFARISRTLDLAAVASFAGKSAPKRRVTAALERLLATAGRLAGPHTPAELIVPAAELRTEARVDTTVLREFAAQGALQLEEREVRRDPAADRRAPPPAPPVALTADQARVVGAIAPTLGEERAFLLHGVTGSGKTEVYARLIERTLGLDRGVIVLVPEIALEPQLAERLAARFPGQLALLHSGLTAGQRYDEWRRVRDGAARIVVGARSALFAPVADPGLIILDEAHEWTYKQEEPAPRYHAREAARQLATLAGATLLLGSATPDVETYARARAGEYRLLRLATRVTSPAPPARDATPLRLVHPAPEPVVPVPAPLPEVEVVDMRTEAAAGNRSSFSRRLAELLRRTLERREQAILFLNRRGSSTFVQCQSCGHVVQCPRCAISYVYHADTEALVCHQCDHQVAVPARCPACWRREIGYFGAGTQRVEAETAALLPTARLLRWDRDTAGGRGAHARFLAAFAAGEADILIGTQLVAKGLDLPRVTLVGIISADTALHLPDFRAGERTFQLVEQVAGRAGRGQMPGRVVLQTLSPDHYAIRAAAAHDYAGFAREELAFRRAHGYPPYGQLIRLLFSHSNQARCQAATSAEAARLVAEVARLGLPDVDVLGPAPAFRRQLRGLFRWQVLLRGADLRPVIDLIGLPREARPASPNAPLFGWTVDIDPVALL